MSRADDHAVHDALEALARFSQRLVRKDPTIGNDELMAKLKQALPVEHALVFEGVVVMPTTPGGSR